jgi:sec-independent protein translocase protein TatA
MGALSPVHLIIILVIALLILGPGKLPETGAALGHAIREFRHAADGKDEPVSPAASTDGPAQATAPLGDRRATSRLTGRTPRDRLGSATH